VIILPLISTSGKRTSNILGSIDGYKIPFLVIPYWLYKNENQDIIKSTIIKFLKTNKFNETFADPDVPQNYKAYHDRMLKMTKCFAKGKANCKELFKKQKTTFEQFLINKNFINK
jgi:hypothetical protein